VSVKNETKQAKIKL